MDSTVEFACDAQGTLDLLLGLRGVAREPERAAGREELFSEPEFSQTRLDPAGAGRSQRPVNG